MQRLRILYQDPFLVAIDKPSGFHVHPPENKAIQISTSRTCLAILSRQLGRQVYPLHRIDYATSGVVLFALDSAFAARMGQLFRERQIRKSYYCVVRGWLADSATIDRPLTSESDRSVKVAAETRFNCLAKVEIKVPVGGFPQGRYSLACVEPVTGRLHQIRRHFAGSGHPLIGDSVYGKSEHNRVFRELGIPSLLLKAQSLRFVHPGTNTPLLIQSRWTGKWHKLFDLFGICAAPNHFC